MIENEAKGCYGSYSKLGRPFAERIHYLLNKEEILSGKFSRKKHNNDFNKSESSPKNKENDIDIFAENANEKIQKDKYISLDSSIHHDPYRTIQINNYYEQRKQNFSFHINTHKLLDKRKNNKLKVRKSIDYNPVMNIIWKRVVSGPQWATLKGREQNNIKNTDFKFYFSDSNFPPNHKIGFIMKKQTQRGPLPIYYDLRIRTDKGFNFKNKYVLTDNNEKSKTKINFRNEKIIKNLKTLNSSECNENTSSSKNENEINLNDEKNDQKNNVKNIINLKKNQLKIKMDNKNKIIKKYFDLNENKNIFKDNHSIDFAKTISREKLNKIKKPKQNIQRNFFSPRYSFVKPRLLSMVYYDKDNKSNTPQKKFIGVESHLFFDPNKIINLVNNHQKTNALNFGIMCGRDNDNDLPSHMLNSNNRVSIDTMTKKSLRMNSYSNEFFDNMRVKPYDKKLYKTIINSILTNSKSSKIKFKSLNKIKTKNKKYENPPSIINNNQLDKINLRTEVNESLKAIKRNKLLDFYF